MNQIHASNELKYKQRRIASQIRKMNDAVPVVVVTGARQVGKSTMLRQEFADYDYLTLDDYALLEQASHDPNSLWKGRSAVIIDEAQKLPRLFSSIKVAVDSSNRGMKFILSGSANMYLMEKVTESLAGRAGYLDLPPMTVGELLETPSTNFALLWKNKLTAAQ